MQAFDQKSHSYQTNLGVGLAGVLVNDCRAKVEIRRLLKAKAAFADIRYILGGVEFDMHSHYCTNNLDLLHGLLLAQSKTPPSYLLVVSLIRLNATFSGAASAHIYWATVTFYAKKSPIFAFYGAGAAICALEGL